MTDEKSSPPGRRVSVWLGIGIFLLPIVFAWFLARRGHSTLARVIGFGWLAVVVIVWLAGLGGTSPTGLNSGITDSSEESASNAAEVASEEPATTVLPPPQVRLTRPQQNAVRSARQYLRISGFSREGLIEQLSSTAGDGYEVADATAAVDSLDIDFNENAARSAEQYLQISGFSCNGLIEQLSSSAGDGYTVSEATYGARQAGAC